MPSLESIRFLSTRPIEGMNSKVIANRFFDICQASKEGLSNLLCALSVTAMAAVPCQAEVVAGPTSSLPPISLSTQIAQATAPPQFIPTDVTPFTVSPERNSFGPGYKFRIFQSLPERLWFNVTTEASQRLDTNVLFTNSHPKADYVFRILPNVTLGYNILRNTAVYANYFLIKDVFADHTFLNEPTTQSLSWGIRHNKQFGQNTNLQFDFQARELWQASHLHQFDFLPGVTLTRMLTPNHIVFASTLLQLRGGDYFVAPTREIDPFYTVGYIYRHGLWTLVINDTLVTNFRHPPFNDSIPQQSNVSMIADIEVNHPVSKRIPSLLAFARAEPIFNWDSHRAPGISGFDFRMYTGLRFTMSKPSYYAAMDDLRRRALESAKADKQQPPVSNNPNENNTASNVDISAPAATDPQLRPPIPAASMTGPAGVTQ